MADISKIVTPGGNEYNLKDATARAAAATMTGASSSAAGTGGTVPAPAAGDQSKFLKGNGTWAYVPETPPPPPFTGATAQMAGTSGLVPAPAAGEQDKVLKGDGTWGSLIDSLEITSSISMGRDSTSSTGTNSTAVGYNVKAVGPYTHAEGYSTTAMYSSAHAEGYNTTAMAFYSHAEGRVTVATGNASHAEGHETVADGNASHAEGHETIANGDTSHAEGHGTTANGRSQHVFGEYNAYESGVDASDRGTYAEIVGNGDDDNTRSNARTLDWDGNEWLAGDLTVGGTRSVMGMVLTPASPISIPSTANSPISLNLEGLTANHVVVAWRFSASAENFPPCKLTITTYDGYFTISNTRGTTDETVQPVFAIPSAVATTTHNE